MISEDDHSLLPQGEDWPSMLARALSKGAADLRSRLGDDLEEWRWERIHQARPRHTLSLAYPELSGILDPPAIPTSGDGDTPWPAVTLRRTRRPPPASRWSAMLTTLLIGTTRYGWSPWAVPATRGANTITTSRRPGDR